MEINIAFALSQNGSFEKKHFGIKHIVNHFIPVQVHEETPEKVKTILLKHMRWLQEELDKQPDQYKLFDINSGILKIAVQKRFK